MMNHVSFRSYIRISTHNGVQKNTVPRFTDNIYVIQPLNVFRRRQKMPHKHFQRADRQSKLNYKSETFYWLYAFFWVIPRRLNFLCQLFRKHCPFHLHRLVGILHTYPPMKMEQTVFRNFGKQNSDAEELPRRKHTIFGTRRKSEIKNFTGRLCCSAPSLKMCLLLLAASPKHVKGNLLRMINRPCVRTLLCK